MNIMHIRHTFGGKSPLAPDEALLYARERFRAIEVFCTRFSYGLWSRWLGFNTALRITGRRMILSGHAFLMPFYRQEVDLWFPGRQPADNTDVITAVSVGHGRYGPCVEIRSQNPRRRRSWMSSPDLTTRIFCENPEDLNRVVDEAMSGG